MVPWPFGASTTSKNIQMFQADSDPFHPDLGDPWEPLQTPHPHGKHCWTHLRYLRFELLASWDDEQSSTHKMVLDSGTHGIPKTLERWVSCWKWWQGMASLCKFRFHMFHVRFPTTHTVLKKREGESMWTHWSDSSENHTKVAIAHGHSKVRFLQTGPQLNSIVSTYSRVFCHSVSPYFFPISVILVKEHPPWLQWIWNYTKFSSDIWLIYRTIIHIPHL